MSTQQQPQSDTEDTGSRQLARRARSDDGDQRAVQRQRVARDLNPVPQTQGQDAVQPTHHGGSRGGAPAVRLDMDLDVDVQLKAKIKGDITLAIL